MGMQTACLSRLPLHTNSTEPTKPSINMLQIGAMPVTVERLKTRHKLRPRAITSVKLHNDRLAKAS